MYYLQENSSDSETFSTRQINSLSYPCLESIYPQKCFQNYNTRENYSSDNYIPKHPRSLSFDHDIFSDLEVVNDVVDSQFLPSLLENSDCSNVNYSEAPTLYPQSFSMVTSRVEPSVEFFPQNSFTSNSSLDPLALYNPSTHSSYLNSCPSLTNNFITCSSSSNQSYSSTPSLNCSSFDSSQSISSNNSVLSISSLTSNVDETLSISSKKRKSTSINKEKIKNQEKSLEKNNNNHIIKTTNNIYIKDENDKINQDDSLEIQPVKKKKVYYVPVSQFPKILKRDFRRHFPQMMSNVFNSNDFSLMEKFTQLFFLKEYEYKDNFSRLNYLCKFSYTKLSPNTTIRLNIDNIHILYLFQQFSLPTMSSIVQNVNLKQKLGDKKVYLDYDVSFDGILLYEVRHSSSVLKNECFYHYIEDKEQYNDVDVNPLINLYHKQIPPGFIRTKNYYKPDIVGEFIFTKLLDNPKKIELNFNFSIVFNENNLVEKVECFQNSINVTDYKLI